jgi:hypothetical protein
MRLLADVAICARDPTKLSATLSALLASPGWQTFATIATESAPEPTGAQASRRCPSSTVSY